MPLEWWTGGKRAYVIAECSVQDKTLNYCSFYTSIPEKLTSNKKEITVLRTLLEAVFLVP